MSKKMPSGTNFFKALIKEDLDERETSRIEEDLPEQSEKKTSINESMATGNQIQDVVKVMEQAASIETKDANSNGISLPEVIPSIKVEENHSVGTNDNQIKKKTKKKPTEDIPSHAAVLPIPLKNTLSSSLILKQRGFYLTSEQYIQIKIRAAQEDCDGSQIVRNAIDAYFNIESK